MKWLSKDDVIFLHSKLILKTGGEDGIRDDKILDSSINSPLQTFDKEDLYPTIFEKITRFSYCLVCNHPFLDGNKRIGALVLCLLFKLNNINFEINNEDLTNSILLLASSELDYERFKIYIFSHINSKEGL